jgi:Putative Actinobacterial Holin-X, holin superfamily III
MEDTTTGRPATAQGSSTADLVKHLAEQIGRLARDEVRLAQLEMMRAGKRAGLGIGMFSGGGLLALYGFGCLLAAAIIALAAAVAAWLAALIIGAGLLAAAGIAALAGRAELKKAKPPAPERAVDSVRADVEEIKESAHR